MARALLRFKRPLFSVDVSAVCLFVPKLCVQYRPHRKMPMARRSLTLSTTSHDCMTSYSWRHNLQSRHIRKLGSTIRVDPWSTHSSQWTGRHLVDLFRLHLSDPVLVTLTYVFSSNLNHLKILTWHICGITIFVKLRLSQAEMFSE